jgi:hypothetical protein
MALDPEISLGIKPPPNPMTTALQGMQMQNLMVESQQRNLAMQSQLAVGQILAESTDPDTGQVDFQKAGVLSKSNAAAAYGLPAAQKAYVDRQISQMDLTSKTIGMLGKVGETQGNILAKYAARADGGSDDEIHKDLADVWETYSKDPAIIDSHRPAIKNQLLMGIKDMPPPGPARAAWMRDHALQFQDMQTKLAANTPDRFEIKTNQGVDVYNIDKMNGKVFHSGTARQDLTPAEGAASTVTPGGVKLPLRDTQLAPPAAGPPVVAPNARTNVLTSAQPNPLAPPAGAGAAPPPATGAPPVVPPAGAPPTQVAAGKAPLQTTYEAELEAPAVKRVEELNERVATGSDIIRQLNEVTPLLDGMRTGGLGAVREKLAQFAQGVGAPQSIVDGIAGGDLSKSQEFEKFMVAYATNNVKQLMSGALGKVTENEWHRFQEANPNLNTDPDAIKKIFNFITGTYQLDKSKQDYFNKARGEPGFNITTWENKWQNELLKRGAIKPEQIPMLPRGSTPPEPTSADHEAALRRIFNPGAKP